MQLPYLVDWSPRQRRQKFALIQSGQLSSLVIPKWKVDVDSSKFPLAKMLMLSIEPVGLQEIQEGGKVKNAAVHNRGC